MDMFDVVESKRFLGPEFLTWLWWKSDTQEGMVGSVELYFDNQVTLEGFLADPEENRFKGGAPAYSPEARLSLRQGKRASSARMKVVKEAREWAFTFTADEFRLSSVRIPAVLGHEDDDRFYERMYLIEEIETIIDDLYHDFLTARLSDGWGDELGSIREWVASDVARSKVDSPQQEMFS